MASYPTSVYSPASKSNGQTITAAFFNDPEAEITAVEDGLKNGLQHQLTVSTGGLTVSTGNTILGQNLTVAGGSTVQSLQVSSNSTFAAPVTFSSGVTLSTGVVRQNSLPSWSVWSTASVAMTLNASSGFTFTGQQFVRGSVSHSTATDSSRVTLNSTGLYYITYNGRVSSTNGPSNVRFTISIRENDSSNILTHRYAGPSVFPAAVGFSALVRIPSTCYLTMHVQSTAPGGSTHGSTAEAEAIRFTGYFVG